MPGGDHLLRRRSAHRIWHQLLQSSLEATDLLGGTAPVAACILSARNVRKRRGTGTAGGQVQQIGHTLLTPFLRWRGTVRRLLCWPAALKAACAS